ncbi:hypothetical protein HHK36_032273 [Tetracentron sinense]|uniref:Fe2OG dioxygenase domain-containing protein n=1 Tax=Tetracentron sinense TaxID=13715 RepID=A0A835CXS3_TETSI|nr:hypothetical protein HHK36_032273 [Tetracentron sinense]
MDSNFDSIPIIDVSPLLTNPEAINMDDPIVYQVLEMLHTACKNVGFFYVKGHGISDTLVRGVREVSRNFFNLPLEEKKKIKLSSTTGYRGYTKLLDNKTQGKPDMHESIDAYKEFAPGAYGPIGENFEGPNLWPEYPQELKQMMEEYGVALEKLSKMITRGIVLALGGSPDIFEGDRAGDSFWLMRCIGYPGSGGAAHPSAIGCEAHTDYGLLILVNQDDNVTALEVQNRSGEWIPAVPIPGTFVCNIGDMLKIWSNVVEPLEFYKQKTGGVAKFNKAHWKLVCSREGGPMGAKHSIICFGRNTAEAMVVLLSCGACPVAFNRVAKPENILFG